MMHCDDVRQWLGSSDSMPETVRDHLSACATCRSYQHDVGSLVQLMTRDADEAPRPGFDTRFFARLEEQRRPRWRLGSKQRWALAGALGAAAVALALILPPRSQPGVPSEAAQDLEVAMHMELLESYDVVARLDELEAYDVLANVELEELEQMLESSGKEETQ